jgi:broad specificity phosphatase PhoE
MHAIYLTHPQVRVDPDTPVPDWGLSEIGRARVEALAGKSWIAAIGRIVSSAERKAVETAEILAPVAGCGVEIVEDTGENDRSATGFLAPPDFEAAADRFFAEPDVSFRGWERAVDAQARIAAAVDRALEGHDPAVPVLFVGHGGVGTLLKCRLGNRPIARAEDQGPGGGGMVFGFSLVDRHLLCDWTPIESFGGFA